MTGSLFSPAVLLLPAFFLLKPVLEILSRTNFLTENYLGEAVIQSGGVYFLLSLLPPLVILRPAYWAPFSLLALVMTLAGFWDDIKGDGSVKGFSGHFRYLLQGRVTSGMIKVITGGGVSLAVSLWVGTGLAAAVVMALSANLLNLLDLRPGRANKAFVVLALVTIPFGGRPALLLLMPLLAASLVFLPVDLQRRAMLGDSGANLLGAALGFLWGINLPGNYLGLLIFFLLLLHAAGEKVSFSRVIERIAPLRWIDLLGRRAEP